MLQSPTTFDRIALHSADFWRLQRFRARDYDCPSRPETLSCVFGRGKGFLTVLALLGAAPNGSQRSRPIPPLLASKELPFEAAWRPTWRKMERGLTGTYQRVVLTEHWENERRVSSHVRSLGRAICQAHKSSETRPRSVTENGDRSLPVSHWSRCTFVRPLFGGLSYAWLSWILVEDRL